MSGTCCAFIKPSADPCPARALPKPLNAGAPEHLSTRISEHRDSLSPSAEPALSVGDASSRRGSAGPLKPQTAPVFPRDK